MLEYYTGLNTNIQALVFLLLSLGVIILFNKSKTKWLAIALCLSCAIVLQFYFHSRTGIIAWALSSFYLFNNTIIKHSVLVFSFIGIVFISFQPTKFNSLEGRWQLVETYIEFIKNKNSYSHLSFPANINHFQIDKQRLSGSENQHSNAHFYVLNDWIYFIMNTNGWLLFLLYLICFFFFLSLLKKYYKIISSSNVKNVLTLLIPFFAFSFFSYSLQIKTTAAIFVILYALLLYYNFLSLNSKFYKFAALGVAIFSIILGVVYVKKAIKLKQQQEETKDLLSIGYIKKANELALQAYQTEPNNYFGIMSYANTLQQLYKISETISFLTNHHNISCSYDYHILLGTLYSQKTNFKNANEHFLYAMDLVPHKIEPKYLLMNNYYTVRDYDSSIYFANSIIKQSPKANYHQYKFFKKEAEKIIMDIGK